MVEVETKISCLFYFTWAGSVYGAKLHGISNSLPVCPIIGGGEGSLISGNLGGESWKLRLQESPLDVDPAGERDRPSVSLQSSGDFLKKAKNKCNC